MLTGKKSIFKSKTIIGILGAGIALWLPGLKPILDIITPDAANLAPQAVADLQEGIRQLVAAASMLFAAWGRLVANEKVTLSGK